MSLTWEGLEEFKAALRKLPSDLTAEAADRVEAAVDITESRLKQSYPLGATGNLRKGVSSQTTTSQFGVVGVVKSTSPHANLWEFGTEERKTRQGWPRGRMKEHYNQGLVGIAIQERQKLQRALIEIVKRAGFTVTGA